MTELVVHVRDYDVQYSWGNGSREHFLNCLEIHLVGDGFYDGQKYPATITLTSLTGDEPDAYDQRWFIPGASVGTVELTTVLALSAAIAKGGLQQLLEVLKVNKPKEVHVTCGEFEANSLGGQRADLMRLSVSTNAAT